MRNLAPLALSAAVMAGCGGASHDPPLPPKPTVVDVTMREYRFDHARNQSMSAGRVVFHVRNAGRLKHQLILFSIPETLRSSLNQQLHSKRRRPVLPLSILPDRRPGQTGIFAADLPPGRYGIVCFLRAANGESARTQRHEFGAAGPMKNIDHSQRICPRRACRRQHIARCAAASAVSPKVPTVVASWDWAIAWFVGGPGGGEARYEETGEEA